MEIIEHTAGRVTGPGLFRMPAEVYHADPAPEPSLSSSIAKVLVDQSAEHARALHPRLTMASEPEAERDPTRVMETGTAAHRLILGEGAELVRLDGDDYRKAAVKEARAAAYAVGKAPILRPDYAKAAALAEQVTQRLARTPGCEGFPGAAAEVVGIHRHKSGVWVRIMCDKLEIGPRHAVIWDVKTGDQSAAPQTLGRRIETMSLDIQAGLYVDVIEALFPHLSGRVQFRWIFAENAAPNAISVAQADATTLHVGRRRVAVALHRWKVAMRTGEWTGYPSQIIHAEYPEWAAKRWAEREELDPTLTGLNYSLDDSPNRPLDWKRAA